MSAVETAAPSAAVAKGRRRWWRRMVTAFVIVAVMAGLFFFGRRAWLAMKGGSSNEVPTAKVQRGDLNLTITAQGELRGKNPQILAAPMTGGGELHITQLVKAGSAVREGETVVAFDTSEQRYKLKEAEADLAEAEQHILQAKAIQDAQEEEDRYALAKAQTDVKLAELDMRKNPLLPQITARQNELALSAAKDHLAQLQQNLKNRAATGTAGVAIQQAGKAKAESQALTARQNIEAMTLKANRDGYVSIKANQSGNFFFFGMTLPPYQVGDSVNPGMAVAEIPDLKNWEIEANIGELDRGHIAIGDAVDVLVIAVPDQKFTGHVADVGGTSGPPWNRRFACKLALDRTSPELRPGMSTRLTITTDHLQNVLWIPSQALFETDGRTYVYVKTGRTFSPTDVKLVRRNESRVVVTGLHEGDEVALANPADVAAKSAHGKSSAAPAVGR